MSNTPRITKGMQIYTATVAIFGVVTILGVVSYKLLTDALPIREEPVIVPMEQEIEPPIIIFINPTEDEDESEVSGIQDEVSGIDGIGVSYTPETIIEIVETPESRYPAISEYERYLLAALAYHEARGEGAVGMQAVVEVAMNRVMSPLFPNTVEEVLFQTKPCVQFTPYKLLKGTTPEQAQYDAVDTAMYGNAILDIDYLYFSLEAVTSKEIIQIGNHRFSK